METALDRLVADYWRIAYDRMRGLPFYNHNLTVEAIGFRDWQGNLILLPAEDDDWREGSDGVSSEWEFPSGRYLFNICRTPDAGLHLGSALFSSMSDFPDQATAHAVAREVMTRLFRPPAPEPVSLAEKEPRTSRLLDRKISRRGLFQWLTPGSMSGGQVDDA
jgi:[NiFe] hydrogenase assembly HybE family chaperone